jgi:2-C-methyl-D-erythritol 4-phosphate cytidylyltransferase
VPAVTAVIAAAGSGERLGAGGPKAFVPLGGRSMIEWSIAAFRACEAVRSIVVAAPPGHPHGLEGDRSDGLGDDLAVVSGGATRARSVANALAPVATELVAIHDAARPLITPELVEDLVAGLASDPDAAGIIAAAPLTDTIKRAHDAAAAAPSRAFSRREGEARLEVERTLDRSRLWAAQTPQVFRAQALREALDVDPEARDAATDEAMLVEAAGGRVLIHPSSGENLKVTTPLDLRVAELLLAERSSAP